VSPRAIDFSGTRAVGFSDEAAQKGRSSDSLSMAA
jgi:hypothetical protein